MHGGTAAGPVTLRTPCTPRTPCTHPLHSQIIKEGASRVCELSYESHFLFPARPRQTLFRWQTSSFSGEILMTSRQLSFIEIQFQRSQSALLVLSDQWWFTLVEGQSGGVPELFMFCAGFVIVSVALCLLVY